VDRLSERTKNLIGWACVGIVVVTISAGLVYAAWRGMLLVPAGTARAWALLATALLPVVGWVAWRLGHWYAQGIVTGIDWGIGKVAQAGSNAADLRVHVHREMKHKPDQVVVLPDVEIVQRTALPSGADIIEL
jgi:hypothetical protein